MHNAQFPANIYCSSSNWKSSISITPAVIPVNPVLPAPIVIAPRDADFDPGIPVVDSMNSLSQPSATGDHIEAPAIAVKTGMHGRVPRPITGRGCRDQLPVATAADDTVVYLCLLLTLPTTS